MKSAVLFLFVLLNIIYLTPIADDSRFWGGLNLITLYGFGAYMCYLVGISEKDKTGRLFFEYVKYMCLSQCFYVAWCIYKGKGYSIGHTDIMAYILGLGFATFLLHCALNNKS